MDLIQIQCEEISDAIRTYLESSLTSLPGFAMQISSISWKYVIHSLPVLPVYIEQKCTGAGRRSRRILPSIRRFRTQLLH